MGWLMSDYTEFKSSRSSNLRTGLCLLLIPISTFYIALFLNEEDILATQGTRAARVVKDIEQAIGWELFVILLVAFGIWIGICAIVLLWKAIDPKADVKVLPDRLEFHPAVKSSSVLYDEVSHWSIHLVNGIHMISIHLEKSYWSLQGLFKRKTIWLKGDKEQLTQITEYFSRHTVMSGKLVP
jgi:hypothetical protein